jgi:DNA-directed RNA polymerase specialized sigma24 family protein
MAVLPASLTLLDAARAGDDGAFEILLQPMLEPGYRLAGGMLQDHHAAQDAVQEAAFKAWRKLRQLRDGSELRPWFLGIVANECRSVRRSRWSSVVKVLAPEKTATPATDAVLSGIQLRMRCEGWTRRSALLSSCTGISTCRSKRSPPSPGPASMRWKDRFNAACTN